VGQRSFGKFAKMKEDSMVRMMKKKHSFAKFPGRFGTERKGRKEEWGTSRWRV